MLVARSLNLIQPSQLHTVLKTMQELIETERRKEKRLQQSQIGNDSLDLRRVCVCVASSVLKMAKASSDGGTNCSRFLENVQTCVGLWFTFVYTKQSALRFLARSVCLLLLEHCLHLIEFKSNA